MGDVVVVLVSGSLRAGSSNTAVLQAAHDAAPEGVCVRFFEGLRDLPAFVPEDGDLPAVVAGVLAELDTANAVLFSTPEYAGGLPGSLKNLLDWTVGASSLYGKPVAWIDVAHPGRGAGARAQLASVLGYVGADVVEEACIHLTVGRSGAGPAVAEEDQASLTAALTTLTTAVMAGGPREA